MFWHKIYVFPGVDRTITVAVNEGLDASLSWIPQGEVFPCFPEGMDSFQ
jgi:hypothetical protein